MIKKILKRVAIIVLGLFVVSTVSVLALDDPLSKLLREKTERGINSYIEHLTDKAFNQQLSPVDRAVLNVGIVTGITYCRFVYPEASVLLYHYVYGDGSDLELDSTYFQESRYLNKKIKTLGVGEHGPIALKQSQDWRFSLAFNPYYLTITKAKVRLFHPNIAFAPLTEESKVLTIVPIGKMRLRVYDNLISAMSPRSFYVYSEWPRTYSQKL